LNPKLFIGRTCDESDNAVGYGNDLEFDNETVSNTHAIIHKVEKGGFVLKVSASTLALYQLCERMPVTSVFVCVQDLDSKRGTYVNGIKLRPFTMVVLFPGMQVHLGDPHQSQSFTVHFLKTNRRRTSSLGSRVP